ncbi:tetratricopeptide repeat-containing sensor histidine kinase [Ferruginibacter sp.]|nr:sensor histidine kinase [Ferruginibacter sp.]
MPVSIKKICSFLLFIFFTLQAFAQGNDPLKEIKLIVTGKEADTVKIMALIDGAFPLALSGDSSALVYTAAIYKLLGNNYSTHYIKLRSMTNNTCGICFMYSGKYDSANYYYNQSLELGWQYDDKLIMAKGYNNLGNVAQYTADFAKAVDYNYKALELFEALKDSSGIAGAYGNLANNYTRLRQYPKAIGFCEQAIAFALRRNDKRLLANSYNTLATIYGEQDKDSLELINEIKAYTLYREIKNIKGLSSTTTNLTEIYINRNAFDSAQKYALLGIGYSKQIDDAQNLGTLYNALGISYNKQNKIAEAIKAFDSVQFYARLTGDKLILSKACNSKAEIFYKLGDFKAAYENMSQYTLLNDSVFNNNMQSGIAEMQTKYETAKKEQKIQQQQFELTKKNYWIGAVIGLLLLGGLLGFSFYRSNKLRATKKLQAAIIQQQDIATKAVIQAEENERKRIAGDLHDGIGQTMSAAKMNLSSIESRLDFKNEEDKTAFEKIVNLVDESCKEVRSVSHNMMPNALLKSGLSSAVKEFIDKIDSRVLKVNLYSEGLNERLDSNVETVLYRVIQECVNNVIKHSNANELDISLIKDADGIAATIEDNGKGFAVDEKLKTAGIGLKNISTRIQYLKGTVDFDSSPGKGTLVAIHVPLAS